VTDGGREALVIELPDRSTLRILRAWTDADGALTDEAPKRQILSTIESLQQLVELIDALRDRA